MQALTTSLFGSCCSPAPQTSEDLEAAVVVANEAATRKRSDRKLTMSSKSANEADSVSKFANESDSVTTASSAKTPRAAGSSLLDFVPHNAVVTIVEPISPVFYMNIVLLNKDEVVDKQVHDKIGAGLGYAVRAKVASALAKRVLRDEKISSELAKKLVENVPKQLTEMGISLDLTTRYIGGPLVVLRATIQETDPATLIRNAKGDEAGKKMSELMGALEFLELSDAQEKMTMKMVQQAKAKLMEKLVVSLPEKMAEQGARVDMCVLEEHEEAEWLFSFLEFQRGEARGEVPSVRSVSSAIRLSEK